MSPEEKPALLGLLRGQRRDTRREWAQLSPSGFGVKGSFRAGECSLRCTVRSGAVQIQRGELGCTCGNRKDPETTETLSQVPARHCPGGGGDADKQNGLLGLPACHRLLTTADVCPIFFFFFWVEEKETRAVPFFYVGRMCQVQVQSDLVERGLEQNTHASRRFILSWSDPW